MNNECVTCGKDFNPAHTSTIMAEELGVDITQIEVSALVCAECILNELKGS